jgi:transcriptional regulator with XRE-family HTH domain
MSANNYGELLKRARDKKTLSLRQVADLAEIDPSLLSRVESGKVDLSLGRAAALCTVLGLSLDALVGNERKGALRKGGRPNTKPVRDLLERALRKLEEIDKVSG